MMFLAYLSFFALRCYWSLRQVILSIIYWVGRCGISILFPHLILEHWNEATKGGLKAVIINRVGDVFFMFALALIWVLFKSFKFNEISKIIDNMDGIDDLASLALVSSVY